MELAVWLLFPTFPTPDFFRFRHYVSHKGVLEQVTVLPLLTHIESATICSSGQNKAVVVSYSQKIERSQPQCPESFSSAARNLNL